MHSQLPTISLYLNSYARSPVKYNQYNNQSTLVAERSPQDSDSSLLSPLKNQCPTRDRNLSSLILMSPDKPQPGPTTHQPIQMQKDGGARLKQVEETALNLSANIFMNSTTKFLKVFASPLVKYNQQKKVAPTTQRENAHISPKKNGITDKNEGKKTNEVITYPSREKIEKIVRGDSVKVLNSIQPGDAVQKLQRTLAATQRSASRSALNNNQSRSERSRTHSGSVERFSRRKSKLRELKFIGKSGKSETSIAMKEAEKKSNPLKNQSNPRKSLNQVKSADSKKPAEATKNTNSRQPVRQPDKQAETPSILSNISDVAPKRAGFKPLFTLPSGELPLETPVKPPLLRVDSSDTLLQKPKTKQQLPSTVSAIKEERTSEMQTKSVKSKQIAFHGSAKEEASTYVHENPTEIAACAGNEAVASKLMKNESTRAIGLSTVYRQQRNNKTEEDARASEAGKPAAARKPEPSKNMPLEPIPSSPSVLEDRKSPMPSALSRRAIKSDKNIKMEPDEKLSSKISIEEKMLPAQQPSQLRPETRLKRLTVLVQAANKLYSRRLEAGIQKISNASKKQKRHAKEGVILANLVSTFSSNLIRNNLRTAMDQLKRLSASNALNKKQPLTLSNSKIVASTVIFRTFSSKQREFLGDLKAAALRRQPDLTVSNKQTRVDLRAVDKSYIFQQFAKIVRSCQTSKASNAFYKLVLYSSKVNKFNPVISSSPPPLLPSQPKRPAKLKPPRDYSSEKAVLHQQTDSIQSELSRIDSRLADRRRYFEREKVKMLRRQEDLTKKNKAAEVEVASKRQKNKALKGQVESGGQELDFSLPECEPFVDTLTDIYALVFRSSSTIVDPRPFIEKHSLCREQPSQLLLEWSAMGENVRLKGQIGRWESGWSQGGQGGPQSSRRALLGEQELVGGLLRSLMRERYLWEWVHVASSV